MDELKKNIESALLTEDSDLISEAIFELDLQYILGSPIEEKEINWIIEKIDIVMLKDNFGSSELVRILQTNWSKMTKESQRKVKLLCERHVDNLKNLATQQSMAEILIGKYVR